MRFPNKVVLITGAGSGIGRASALKFASEGANVVVTDIDEEHGRETVQQIMHAGGHAIFVWTDVGDYDSVRQAVDSAVNTFGSIDIMFNNAGIGIYKPLLDQTPEDYDKVIRVNQHGVFYGILAAARRMRDLRVKGVIVNTASVYSFMASENRIAYHASKAAVKLMTQAAALELAQFGIRVVAVAPGFVDTPIVEKFRDDERLWQFLGESSHMRRTIISPEEVANVVVLLASDEASVINGSVVMADDGYVSFKFRFEQ